VRSPAHGADVPAAGADGRLQTGRVELSGSRAHTRRTPREGYMPDTHQVMVAWVIIWLVVFWSFLWKTIAMWKAARRDQLGWYVFLAIAPPFGILEMIYVFLVSPRIPDIVQSGANDVLLQ
jgi:methionyl-tRNA synthetase